MMFWTDWDMFEIFSTLLGLKNSFSSSELCRKIVDLAVLSAVVKENAYKNIQNGKISYFSGKIR